MSRSAVAIGQAQERVHLPALDPQASLLAPMDDRIVNDRARRIEQLVSLERVVSEGMYGSRRIFITLFNSEEANAKDLLSARETIKAAQHGSTRTKVYLDSVEIPYVLAGQRLLEHVRTVFVRTGEAPSTAHAGLPGMDDVAP